MIFFEIQSPYNSGAVRLDLLDDCEAYLLVSLVFAPLDIYFRVSSPRSFDHRRTQVCPIVSLRSQISTCGKCRHHHIVRWGTSCDPCIWREYAFSLLMVWSKTGPASLCPSMSVVQTLLCISASFFVALQAGFRGGSVYPFKCSWRFVFFIHLRMAASAGFHISLDPEKLLVHLGRHQKAAV